MVNKFHKEKASKRLSVTGVSKKKLSEMVTVDEAAAMLGVSKNTVYSHINRGRLSYLKMGILLDPVEVVGMKGRGPGRPKGQKKCRSSKDDLII